MNHLKSVVLLLAIILSGINTAAFAEEVRIKHQGLSLNANWVMAIEDWQSKPVLLMTHGTLAHGRMEIMDTLQQLFSDNGVSSLTPSLSLGLDDRHGMYDCAETHKHRHTDALDEIGVWLDWLKSEGAQQVILAGHSRGGNQSAWFAAERDDPLIKKVMLIAPATWSAEYAANNYQSRYKKELAPILESAGQLVAAGKPDTLMEHVDFIYCADTTATAEAFVSYYREDPRLDTTYLLPKIAKPVMVFAGSEDTSVKDLDIILEPLAEKRIIDLVVIDGADHFFRDLYSDELVEEALPFIEGP